MVSNLKKPLSVPHQFLTPPMVRKINIIMVIDYVSPFSFSLANNEQFPIRCQAFQDHVHNVSEYVPFNQRTNCVSVKTSIVISGY